MINTIIKHKNALLVSVLLIFLTYAIYEIKVKNNEIDNLEYQLGTLNDKVDELENTISEFQENQELRNSANNYRTIQQEYKNNYRTIETEYQNNYNSTDEINESDVYKSKGTAVVVYKQRGCDYMILENSSGYIIAQWMGDNDPDKGDNIAGTFNSFGTKKFYNLSSNSECRLWIDDYMLSKDRALEKIKEKCE